MRRVVVYLTDDVPDTSARALRPQSDLVAQMITLEYVVGTTGRADLGTVRHRWVSDEPRPTGPLAVHHQAFVNAARSSLAKARVHPARTGGCPVPRLVQQPFVFKQRRG